MGLTYRYARDRAMTLLIQGAHIERRSKTTPRSRTDSKDVYYLVWDQPQDNAGLVLTCERRMWRQTFFRLLKDKTIVARWEPGMRGLEKSEAEPTQWVLNK